MPPLRQRGPLPVVWFVLVAVLCCPGGAWHPQGALRPAPSHDLPVIDLIESPDRMYDPGPQDLDPVHLKKLLGHRFDANVMSLHRPKESIRHPNGTLQPGFRLKRGRLVPKSKMPRDIQKLRLRNLHFPGGHNVRLDAGRRLRRKMRQLLWTYTYCPLVYRWKDLGIRFWPRWIRDGRCYNGRSCSFPAGMTCKEKSSAEKTILRWHCRDWLTRTDCRWIPATLTILVECVCAC
ncbi:noggin-2-like [Ornithodoros turicata]|uniref:noggin-2-like n=1 Tax=Ornithodoros turicata TaxID=34597 RepID=UPI003139F81A